MHTRFIALPLVTVAFLLVGCGAADSAATATPVSPVASPIVVATPSPPVSPTVPLPASPTVIKVPTTIPLVTSGTGGPALPAGAIPADAATAVANARAALAAAAGLDPATISVGTVTPAEWPNSALGCEQPGRAYIEVITPGYVVELIHGSTRTLYHAGRSAGAVTCADAGP